MTHWQRGGVTDRDGYRPPTDPIGWIAPVIPVGCLVVLAGALVAGLTIGGGADAMTWKGRVKVAALSFGVSGGGAASAIAIAAALLVALAISRLGETGPGVNGAVCLAAVWLVVVTALGTFVDVSSISDAPDSGYFVGQLLNDIGTLTLAGAAAVLGGWFFKS